MRHNRRYSKGKNGESYVLPIWNGILDHRQQMGSAIWEFIWCIDKIIDEKSSVGMVLNGAPVKLKDIVADIPGSDLETTRLHMRKLEKGGYIKRRRTPCGYVIQVLKSKKRDIWKSEKPQNIVSLPEEKPQNAGTETVFRGEPNRKAWVNKEDAAVDSALNAAVRAACPVWKETGVDPLRLPGPFRKLCEDFWLTRNGQSTFEFMGIVLDAWQAIGEKGYPPAWVKRKSEIGRAAKANQAPELPELEAIPWKK